MDRRTGATGLGAERTCDLGRCRSLHERVVAWDEGRSFTVKPAPISTSPMPIDDYVEEDLARFRLRPQWAAAPEG